ncbi:MAG TPA: hypothetical protein VIV11_08860 [Kofleriaceae bacterium]
MDLEQQLAAARARRDAAQKALASKHKGGEWDEYRAADKALLAAERELAAARNEEHAVPLEFPVEWDRGAPLPQLLVNDYRALLLFFAKVPDPKWDGTYVTIKDPSSNQSEALALVEFKHCLSAKLGSPNDEVFHGHPLAGKGLEGYTAQLVKSSRWIAEIQKINSVHAGYRADAWVKPNHYVFWFHDTTFECIAEAFEVELHQCSMSELLAQASRRLIK